MIKLKHFLSIVIFMTFLKPSSAAGIIGYDNITPGVNYNYYVNGIVVTPTWSVSTGASIVSTVGGNVTIKASVTAPCTVTLTANAGTFGIFTKSIKVDPHINGPTVAYAGEPATFSIVDPCNNYFCYSYSWTASPICSSGCGLNSNSFAVTPSATNPPATFNVNCYLSCPAGYNGNMMNYPVSVKLHPPTITASGPTYCNTPMTFTASSPNATSYTWTVPSTWQIVGTPTNVISVIPNGGGNGTVSCIAKLGTTITSTAASIVVTMNNDDSRHNLIALPNSDVFYIGTDQKIHRMYWTTTWNYEHIVPSGGWGNIAVEGWLTKSMDNKSIYFKSIDKKLYMLTYPVNPGDPWTCQQITAAQVDVKGNIACREDGIFYIGTDDHIHRVYDSGGSWSYQALIPSNWQGITIMGNLALAPYPGNNIYFRTTSGRLYNLYGSYSAIEQGEIATSSGCSGDIVVYQPTGRVYFRSSDKIHYVDWVTGVGWQESAIGASNTNYIINGYMIVDSYNRVFYKGSDGKLHNVYTSGSSWLDYPLNDYLGGVAGDIVFFDNKLIYVNTDNTVHQYSWPMPSGPWYDEPFTIYKVKTCTTQYSALTKSTAAAEEEQESIEEATDNPEIALYPNPANGIFTIELLSEGLSELSVFDVLGNKVKTFSSNGKEKITVNLSGYPKGIYLVNINQANRQLSKKIILE